MLPKLSRSFRLHHLLLALAMAAGLFALVPGGADAQAPGLPPVGTNFAAPGPYAVTVQNDAAHTYYSPATLGEGGVDHPIILWGNGTGTTPPVYDGLLRHFASHGFVVAAANTSNAGSGNEMLAGLDNLTVFNGQSGNRFFGHLDLGHVGATGHSQGAGGAVATARDPRIDTIFPLQGYGAPTARAGLTAVYFAGQNDTILTPTVVRGSYTGSSGIPAAYAELAGATHFVPVGNAGGFRGPATAWARWHLAGDGNGRGLFVGAGCGLCSSPEWSAYEANPRLQEPGPAHPDHHHDVHDVDLDPRADDHDHRGPAGRVRHRPELRPHPGRPGQPPVPPGAGRRVRRRARLLVPVVCTAPDRSRYLGSGPRLLAPTRVGPAAALRVAAAGPACPSRLPFRRLRVARN